MSRVTHKIFISILISIVIVTFAILLYKGISYYNTSMEERFFHADHNSLKPSGLVGHGLGIIGSLLMIFGMLSYMARKRFHILSRWGLLKHWLEFHIFLCTLRPMMVMFHTSFKFGGIVSISFWSMVAVFLSGIIGRFIYIQIPRSIEGRELSLNEVRDMRADICEFLKSNNRLNDEAYRVILSAIAIKSDTVYRNPFGRHINRYVNDYKVLGKVRSVLRMNELLPGEIKKIVGFVKKDISLSRKIERLNTMQKLFNYWHVAHMPFALVMLIIMVIHVAVTIVFGYKWIF
jgi:hypothetical protein